MSCENPGVQVVLPGKAMILREGDRHDENRLRYMKALGNRKDGDKGPFFCPLPSKDCSFMSRLPCFDTFPRYRKVAGAPRLWGKSPEV